MKNEIKTFEEIAIKNGHCVCGRMYTERNLIAPECEAHSMQETAVEFAEQFKPKWVSVETPPEEATDVLVFGKHYFDIPVSAYLYNGSWFGSIELTDQMVDGYVNDRRLTSGHRITHWTPLPQSPKL